MPDQWWAVVDLDGELVSSGTVLADPLPAGLEAVATVAPEPGRAWDRDELAWYTPDPAPAPPNAAAVLVALSAVAANGALTTEQKLDQVFAILAAANQPAQE